jgi:hypothetical protein
MPQNVPVKEVFIQTSLLKLKVDEVLLLWCLYENYLQLAG